MPEILPPFGYGTSPPPPPPPPPPGTLPLEPPTLSVSAVGDSEVSLSMTAVTGSTNYTVYVGTSSGGEDSTPAYSGAGLTPTISGLTNGTTYYFNSRSYNGAISSASNEVSATPMMPPPPPPPGTSPEFDPTNTYTAAITLSSSNTVATVTSAPATSSGFASAEALGAVDSSSSTWYQFTVVPTVEFVVSGNGIGICALDTPNNDYFASGPTGYAFSSSGYLVHNGGVSGGGAVWGSFGVPIDIFLANNSLWIAVNGVVAGGGVPGVSGALFTGIPNQMCVPAYYAGGDAVGNALKFVASTLFSGFTQWPSS